MSLRRVVLGVMVVLILGAGCTSDPTQSDEYLQLESQKSDVEAELVQVQEAADEAAVEAGVDLGLLRAEVLSLEDELADTSASLVARSESVARLAQAVENVIAMNLWVALEFLDELESLGVDVSVADQIVVDREWGESWAGFAFEWGFDVVTSTTRTVDDDVLNDAWADYLFTPSGSDEELVALWDYLLQSWKLTLERQDEALSEK